MRAEFALVEFDRADRDWADANWFDRDWFDRDWVHRDWALVDRQDVSSKGSSHSAGKGTSKAFSVSEIRQ